MNAPATLKNAQLTGTIYNGFTVTTRDGKPAHLAIIDEAGNIIDAGTAVAREDCIAGYRHTHSERPSEWVVSPKKDGVTDADIERWIAECG